MESGSVAAGQAVSQSATGAKAGFWTRFVAALIDGVVLGVVSFVLVLALHAVGYGIEFLVSLAYFTYLEGSTGQTLGKKSMQIKVVDTDGGGPIGYGRAAVRWFGRILSALVIYLGYLWMLWDKDKQCWHDKLANDYVVKSA
jgi:uncharacterized RDD family membrane protein YckC